jgi:hypothetical protein
MEECHCWIGNSGEGFEVDCFEVDCFEVDWPNDCPAPKKVNAMSSGGSGKHEKDGLRLA